MKRKALQLDKLRQMRLFALIDTSDAALYDLSSRATLYLPNHSVSTFLLTLTAPFYFLTNKNIYFPLRKNAGNIPIFNLLDEASVPSAVDFSLHAC
jgi:hypothetical protein